MTNVLVDNAKLASDVVPPITGPGIGYTSLYLDTGWGKYLPLVTIHSLVVI